MKKLLLTFGALALTTSAFATNWLRSANPLSSEDIQALAGQQKQVVVKTSSRTTTGWFKPYTTNQETGYGYFATCDTEFPEDNEVFSDEFVYTMIVSEDGQSFTFQNSLGLFPPQTATTNYNLVEASKVDNVENATFFMIHNSINATSHVAGRYLFRIANKTLTNYDYLDLHMSDANNVVDDKIGPMYFKTGAAGLTDPWNTGRTSAANQIFLVSEAASVVSRDVTLVFNGISGERLTKTINTVQTDANTLIEGNCPEYFTPSGIAGNATISDANTEFTVNGTWTFPFTLNRVFRADLRKSNASNCTKWTVNADNQVSTRSNANAGTFAPENLFYLKGNGYNSDNRLIVTLHTLAADDNFGINCASANSSKGTFTAVPTHWIVKTNSNSTTEDPGISLQHVDAADAHLNDVGGLLGVWNYSASQNDGGSFIRFFDLTDSDFETTSWENNGTYYILGAEARAAAQANPTAENVRAIFTTATEAPAVTLTVKLKHNNHLVATAQVTGVIGTQHTIEAPAFFNDVITVTIPATDSTIDYTLTELALPFKYTETTDNMIWQAVHIHASYANNRDYTWTYGEADSKTIVEYRPADVATNGYADTQLWAFVGNMGDGFKIYNKAAGTGMWLYEEGIENTNNVKVGTTETGSTWKPSLSRTNTESTTYCCFSTVGNHYINLNVNTDNGTTLTHWTDADQGSTCWFVAPAEPMLPTVADYIFEEYVSPANAVGAIDYNGIDFSNGPEIIAAATADKYDLDAAEALRNLIALYTANVTTVSFNPNNYYRLQSINSSQVVYTGSFDEEGNADNAIYTEDIAGHRMNYHTIFQFEPVADQADRYYIKSQGLYLGTTNGQGQHVYQVEADAPRGEFSLAHSNYDSDPNVNTCAAWVIGDNTQADYNYLHQGPNSSYIQSWRQFAPGSHFYILTAEHIDVALDQQHDNMNVGFGYFPFAVSTLDDNTKLYYLYEGTHKETGETVITYKEVDVVPAHTAFMVSNSESTTATLAIGAPAAANARRRAIAAEGNNKITDGFADTDTWTGDSWTKDENVPAEIAALGVNAANVRYMDRTMTFDNGGDLTADFQYSSGYHRLDICGVVLLNADGTIVTGDFHTGFSGTNKDNNVYTLKVPTAGTYTVRYYAYNADDAMNTNGNINLTFIAKNNANLLAGHLRQNNVEAGNFVLGQTSEGLGFVKATEATKVNGNYVYIPAENLYDQTLAAADELPLVNQVNTTGISELNVEQPAAAKVIYDLQGRRLSAPVKGLNIINGAKVLVK